MPLSFRFLGKGLVMRRPPSASAAEPSIADGARDPEQGVVVVGCGRMGCAIAGELARRGCFVAMYDETEFSTNDAKHNLQAALLDHVKQGLMPSAEACSSLMSRIRLAEDLEQAVARAVLVFEAVVDELALKRRLFHKMALSGSPALLTTNTINLSVGAINAPFNDGTELQV
jgi:3-hydroxyacyl-CoA dehydrogenase